MFRIVKKSMRNGFPVGPGTLASIIIVITREYLTSRQYRRPAPHGATPAPQVGV
jgi:hypothetical protein